MLTFWQWVILVTIFCMELIGLTVLKTELEIRKAKKLQKSALDDSMKMLDAFAKFDGPCKKNVSEFDDNKDDLKF